MLFCLPFHFVPIKKVSFQDVRYQRYVLFFFFYVNSLSNDYSMLQIKFLKSEEHSERRLLETFQCSQMITGNLFKTSQNVQPITKCHHDFWRQWFTKFINLSEQQTTKKGSYIDGCEASVDAKFKMLVLVCGHKAHLRPYLSSFLTGLIFK